MGIICKLYSFPNSEIEVIVLHGQNAFQRDVQNGNPSLPNANGYSEDENEASSPCAFVWAPGTS